MPGSTAQTPSGADPVVLVIDDVALVREVVRAGLRRHGFEVRLAGDGSEGVELYRRDHQAIALLDIQMPGLDGPAVLTSLQAINPTVRAFFMTGNPGGYSADELLAKGVRGLFAKPLAFAAVAAEFRRSLVDTSREDSIAPSAGAESMADAEAELRPNGMILVGGE